MVLTLKHWVVWELIRKRKQGQINKYNTRENIHIVDYNYKVGDNIILTKHTAYKYEIPYMGPFVRAQCFTNGMVKLQNGGT